MEIILALFFTKVRKGEWSKCLWTAANFDLPITRLEESIKLKQS